MVIIKDRKGKFLNFFTASMVVGVGGLLLSFLTILISFIIVLTDFYLPFDYIVLSLLILFLAQFIGIFIVYYVFIPLFKVKNSEYHPITFSNSIRTIFLISGTFTLIVSINFVLFYIFRAFNLSPQSGYTNILLSPEHLTNPLNILIYYLPLIIGAPVYEELVYRRLLVPLLEKRGMNPLTAILSSSLLFAFAHLPDDLISGNLTGTIMHISAVFLIGLSLGLIYILTRNVFFSIIIHGILNFISFSGPLVTVIANNTLTLAYDIIYWTIYIVGFGVLIYGLWQFFRKRDDGGIVLVREKNTKPILKGFLGFLFIGLVSIFIPLIIQLIIVNLGIAVYNVSLYFIILIMSYGVAVILFSWLGTRTRYDSKNDLFYIQI
ncbi:MAG: CPBP family intramembrane glutamic endopeptidase [Promethearchaeota archaeon]|jgi:membrane protease YdiL (CAAX protease family)